MAEIVEVVPEAGAPPVEAVPESGTPPVGVAEAGKPPEKPEKKGVCGKCPFGCGFPICILCALVLLLIVLKIANVI